MSTLAEQGLLQEGDILSYRREFPDLQLVVEKDVLVCPTGYGLPVWTAATDFAPDRFNRSAHLHSRCFDTTGHLTQLAWVPSHQWA